MCEVRRSGKWEGGCFGGCGVLVGPQELFLAPQILISVFHTPFRTTCWSEALKHLFDSLKNTNPSIRHFLDVPLVTEELAALHQHVPPQ